MQRYVKDMLSHAHSLYPCMQDIVCRYQISYVDRETILRTGSRNVSGRGHTCDIIKETRNFIKMRLLDEGPLELTIQPTLPDEASVYPGAS